MSVMTSNFWLGRVEKKYTLVQWKKWPSNTNGKIEWKILL